jgi:hypothetical protein
MRERVSTAIAGLISLLISLYLALMVLLGAVVAAQRPDPSVPNGDPCCPHPDTWGEVASWSFGALSLASIDALIFTVAVGCLAIAGSGRRPSWQNLRWIPVGVVGATAALMAVLLATEA